MPKPPDGDHRFRFSDQTVARLRPAAKRSYYSDAERRGLLLTVHPSGRKVFSLYRKLNGRPERILLGPFPELDVQHARAQAAAINESLARGETSIEIQKLTCGELFVAYI